ncbi:MULTISPECIES: cupin domain-containing protein [unclassified Mesorhizobium]|uniref:cupin domain-containing protein n=1 Tax=unclassified Mesorhizobium TaxID=325217 RepID=UPI000FD48003|nr:MULTISPECIES: cupin domain-containing protein [unclassified Mesorhizobium]RVB75357.1 cupin domain-containing protein [Mesorhizobium sp. M6A.T.Cr.TU.014.01.1.1]RWP82709.1 MAG: cupin domain-containing protein [Mesorhizobium sp.]RWQ05997.1 MAG: cupin domain-containing protein [Mesorhizobium sp.]RWQ11830.1 MAG: cupin domain-containing protein [Mesorhizobium sp.]RWQ67028.1 MAG: cupin domain-containing protein [Mesorhizobium sp.]
MLDTAISERAAHLVDPRNVETLDVLGPVVQFLTAPRDGEPCVMRGTIPPGVTVPLHSHADPETFIQISGEIEGLSQSPKGFVWVSIRPGDIFHVPGGAKHAFRNLSTEAAVMILVSTSRIGRFFREVGKPTAGESRHSDPPSAEAVQHFLKTAAAYGYWNATPEENASVGLSLT